MLVRCAISLWPWGISVLELYLSPYNLAKLTSCIKEGGHYALTSRWISLRRLLMKHSFNASSCSVLCDSQEQQILCNTLWQTILVEFEQQLPWRFKQRWATFDLYCLFNWFHERNWAVLCDIWCYGIAIPAMCITTMLICSSSSIWQKSKYWQISSSRHRAHQIWEDQIAPF